MSHSPALPAATTFIVLLLLQAFHAVAFVRAIDARSRERETALLEAAVDLRLASLEAVVDDNGYWDDAALAVRSAELDEGFVARTWGAQTLNSMAYSGAFISDASGRAVIGYIRGERLAPDQLTAISTLVPRLRHRLGTDRDSRSGMILYQGIPLLVATSLVTPNTPGLVQQDAPARALTLTRRLDQDVVEELNRSVGLNGLRFGPPRPSEVALTLTEADGTAVAQLSWVPDRPGLETILAHSRWIAASLLLCLIVVLVVARASIEATRRLTAAALSDALSGLPNRRAFRAHVGRELLTNRPICVALLDLDGFKSVNDIYGHGVGDQLLLAAARALRDLAGDGAMVARLGGDEFAVATSGDSAGPRLEALVEAFIARTRQPFRVEERTLLVGASAGLALAALGEADAGELMRRADVALYAAKRGGKGRACWYHGDLDRREAEAHALAEELRRGLAEGAFRVVYQPIIRDREGTIAGVEALLRYAPAGRPPVSPGAFIPVAEETGLIDRIGLFALRRACEDIRPLEGLHLAVNLSAAQLRNPDLPDSIESVLAETGFPPERLELEVTETYLVSDPELARRTLDRLRALGVTICLDDFGTGYASLGFLRRFPFDRLKLDRSLVVQATEDSASRALLDASIALARVLGMTVVAEGIETAAQRDAMLAAGCDLLQGWLFARELAAADLAARWVRAGHVRIPSAPVTPAEG